MRLANNDMDCAKGGPRPLRIGIARCLLGDAVRYDGSGKLDRYLRDVLGTFVEFVPVCPEVECGMGTPREAVRLVGDLETPRLVGRKTGEDWTRRMREWGEARLAELEREDLCGYVFKARSPSSGMARVKVYPEGGGQPRYDGVGMWARMVMERFPLLPFEDEGRLNDMGIRENFVTRIFVMRRWRDLLAAGLTTGRLVDFHTRHKMLILAHNQAAYREMGRLVAQAADMDPEALACEYLTLLSRALSRRATVKSHTNVLMHAAGYFRRQLSADERAELSELIETYRRGLVPRIAPLTLLNHYVRKYDESYLGGQIYLHPHPVELRLLFHA
ncbi:YbgA family protein [Desulfobaculum xiamenense]